MSNLPTITEIRFTPCKEKDGLVGFVDFIYDGTIKIQGAGVHHTFNYRDNTYVSYRLVYPNNLTGRQTMFPIKRQVSKHIDHIISETVNQQLKGAHDGNQKQEGRQPS